MVEELSRSDVDPLVAAYRNPSPVARLAALRAVVRLPVSPAVWIETGGFVQYLLGSDPQGMTFEDQTLDGIPFRQVIDAAVHIPVRRVRQALYRLLEGAERDTRLATADALARAHDPLVVRLLVQELREAKGEASLFPAELLSYLNVIEVMDDVADAYHQERDPDTRFWLAVAVAQAGEKWALEEVLRQLDGGHLDLRMTWGDPERFGVELAARGPLPERVREWLGTIASQELHTDLARQAAASLYEGGQPVAESQAHEPPSEPAADPELEGLAAEVVRAYQEQGELGEPLARRSLRPDILPYLPPDPAARLATAMFWEAFRGGDAGGLGNPIVEAIYQARQRFQPDITGLFGLYMALWEDADIETQYWLPWSIRWQVAWTVSRAGLPRIIAELRPHLETGFEREVALAARLIEEASLYRDQDYPPIFGGGSAPSDAVPSINKFIEEDMQAGNGGSQAKPPRGGEGAEPPGEAGVAGEAHELESGSVGLEAWPKTLENRPRSRWPHIFLSRTSAKLDFPAGLLEQPGPGSALGLPPESESEDAGTPGGAERPKNGEGHADARHEHPGSETSRGMERVVNTGFAPKSNPDDEIEPVMPLRAGADYYFWLDIGRPQARSIETIPVDIPTVPAQSRLTVALFRFEDGIQTTPGADVGELLVQGNGAVIVTRQPLGEGAPESAHAANRLLFPVRMPDRTGSYRMRCNIYWGQILLQSRIVHAAARLRRRPTQRGKAPLRSVLDYTLSRALAPAHLNRLSEHRLSVMLNANEDGSHSLHLLGAGEKGLFKNDDIRFQGGELHGMITQARQALRIASWGNPDEWQTGVIYKYKDRQLQVDRLKNDLINLASWGYEFYTMVRDRLAGGEAAVAAFEGLMREPCGVQLAMKESPSYVLPSAMIYDHPLDVGAPGLELCPSFAGALLAHQPLEDHECFNGRCPTRDDITMVCPSGFWGFRHFLGMPLSVADAPDVPAEIAIGTDLNMSVGVYTDMQLLQPHEQALLGLRNNLRWNHAGTRAKVFAALKAAPHIVYFYCHGGLSRGAPFLQVGSNDHPELILRSNLYAHNIVWDAPRPLVFINGCHTTAVDPLEALEFISPLVTYSHCAGVIGTEITIFEEMATTFAEECFRRFFRGDSIGSAIRSARLKLLAEGNPLGLVYIPFVIAGLRLVQVS